MKPDYRIRYTYAPYGKEASEAAYPRAEGCLRYPSRRRLDGLIGMGAARGVRAYGRSCR